MDGLPHLHPSLLVHQGRHRKGKGTGCRPNENIRTSHGKGHTQIARPHFQKEMPAHIGKIHKNIRRKDLALAQDVPDPLERIGRAFDRWFDVNVVVIVVGFDVLLVFAVAGIVQSIPRHKDPVVAGGRRVGYRWSDGLTDFPDNVKGGTDVKDAKDRIGKQPSIAPIQVVVRVSMQVQFRGNPTENRHGVHGNRDGVEEDKGGLKANSVVSIVGVVHFVR